MAGGAEPAGAGAPAAQPARALSGARADARAGALVHAADAAAGDRFYWRAHPVRADRLARVLAARSGAPAGWTWRLGDGRGRAAGELSQSAGAVPRGRLHPRSGLLLRVRAAGLPLRLARRPVGARTQRQCRLAHRLRGGVAIMECAERFRPGDQAAAVAALRQHRQAAVEDRRGRPSHAAVPGLARAARE